MLGAPLGSLPVCPVSSPGGLVCYCCSAEGGPCPRIISCPGCNSTSGSETPPRWSPEMILDFADPACCVYPVSYETVSFPVPETVYLEVPVKPPNAA